MNVVKKTKKDHNVIILFIVFEFWVFIEKSQSPFIYFF